MLLGDFLFACRMYPPPSWVTPLNKCCYNHKRRYITTCNWLTAVYSLTLVASATPSTTATCPTLAECWNRENSAIWNNDAQSVGPGSPNVPGRIALMAISSPPSLFCHVLMISENLFKYHKRHVSAEKRVIKVFTWPESEYPPKNRFQWIPRCVLKKFAY